MLAYSMLYRYTPERRELDYLRMLGASNQSAKEVKIFGLGQHLADRSRTLFDRFYEENKALAIKRAVTGSLLNLLPTAGYYGAYVLILVRTMAGAMTVGSLTFVAGAFARSRSLDRDAVFEPQQHRRAGALHQGSFRFLRDRAQHRFGAQCIARAAPHPIRLRVSRRVVRLSRLGAAGAAPRELSLRCRRAHRSDRRKRRGQNHARQAARAPLRTHRRRDFAGRRRSARIRRRQPARRNRRHFSGLHALRHAGAREHRLRAHRGTRQPGRAWKARRGRAWPSR